MKQEQFVKGFRIGDLFTIKHPAPRSISNYQKGKIPFVASGSSNNGIIDYIKPNFNEQIDEGNCISVNPIDGTSYYQPYNFVGRGGSGASINLLYKKNNSPLNENSALFICALIKKRAYEFSYTNLLNGKRLENLVISLPIKPKIDFATIREIILRGGVEMLEHINTSSWVEFKLEDLFESLNGSVDIQNSDINNQGVFVVSSGTQNSGIIGKSNIDAPIISSNTITVDMFGNVFYRDFPYKMVTHARVFALKSNYLSQENGLFFVSCIKKITSKFSYSNMCSWKKIKDLTIKLPVLPVSDEKNYSADDINYELMESIIRELEEERIRELEAYLQVTGLNNTVLTPEEEQALRIGPGG